MILKLFRNFFNHRKSIEYKIISDEQSFNLAVKKLRSFQRISLDTEFLWRKTYFPVLSLIQIKLGNKIFIFDCIKLKKLDPLTEILEDDKILKIIHSSRSDSNVLFMSKNILIKGTFDIQVAENILDKSKHIFNSQVPRDEALQLMTKSFHCLVSVGNLNSNQIPSKVIEYIATGKPIIHFTEIDDDPVMHIAEQFNNLFIIKKDTNIENFKKELNNYFLDIQNFNIKTFNRLYSPKSLIEKLNTF